MRGALLLLSLLLAGCGVQGAWGVEGARHFGDAVEVDFRAGMDRTWAAALEAARALDLPVEAVEEQAHERSFETRLGGRAALVRVEADTSSYSMLTVVLGWGADPDPAVPFLREVERRLAEEE